MGHGALSKYTPNIVVAVKKHFWLCNACKQYFVITACAVALFPHRLQLTLGLPLIAIAIKGLGAYTWLRFWLRPRFYFVDYIHAHR
jgi:hypothetical protein